jgi:hypothetical protein
MTKEEFVANAVQVEMQGCHLYIVCYVAMVRSVRYVINRVARLVG